MKAILMLFVGCDTTKVVLEGDDECADPPCTSGDPGDTSASDTDDTGSPASSGRWEGDVVLADVGLRISGVHQNGAAGWDLAIGDNDADGRDDLVIGAPCAGPDYTCPGQAYAVNGPITAGGSLSDLADGIATGQAYEAAGRGVAFLGDADGDGHADFAVAGDGSVARFSAGLSGEVSTGAAGTTWRNGQDLYFGNGIAAAGDPSGDGVVDLLVASSGYYDVNGCGEAWLFSGAAGGQDFEGADALAHIDATPDWLSVGTGVGGPGDVDGDGVDDVMVSAIALDGWHSVVGTFPGPVVGELTFDDAEGFIVSSAQSDNLGGMGLTYASTIRGAGDVDGDGYGDVWLTAPGPFSETAIGTVYLVPGPINGWMDPADSLVTIQGTDDQPGLGVDIAVTDLDGDDEADVVLGGMGASYAGSVSIFYGPVEGNLRDVDADATFRGGTATGFLGVSLAAGGDLTGDGLPDLAVGAPMEDGDVNTAGNVWILPGR